MLKKFTLSANSANASHSRNIAAAGEDCVSMVDTTVDNAPDTANVETTSDDKIVTLISRDDKTFELPKSAATLSSFISDTLGFEDEVEEPEEYSHVPLLRVEGDCLQKVVDFLIHFQHDPLPEIRQPLIGHSFFDVRNNCNSHHRPPIAEIITHILTLPSLISHYRL